MAATHVTQAQQQAELQKRLWQLPTTFGAIWMPVSFETIY